MPNRSRTKRSSLPKQTRGDSSRGEKIVVSKAQPDGTYKALSRQELHDLSKEREEKLKALVEKATGVKLASAYTIDRLQELQHWSKIPIGERLRYLGKALELSVALDHSTAKRRQELIEVERARVASELGTNPETFRLELPRVLSHSQTNELQKLSVLRTTQKQLVFDKILFSDDDETDSLVAYFIEKYKKLLYPESVDAEQEEKKGASLRDGFGSAKQHPRWAEANRPTVQLGMRVSSQMLANVENAASEAGMERSDWYKNFLRQCVEDALANGSTPIVPPEYPDFKATKRLKVRIEPELKQQIEDLASHSGLSEAEWVKRWINLRTSPTTYSPGQSLDS